MLGIVKLYVIIWDLIFLVQLRTEAMDSTFRRTAVIIWGNIDGKSKSQKTQNILLQTPNTNKLFNRTKTVFPCENDVF